MDIQTFQINLFLNNFVEEIVRRKVNFRVFRINIIIYSSLSSEDSLLLIRLLPVRVFPLLGPKTKKKYDTINTLHNTNVWVTFLAFGFNFWEKQDESL